MDAGSSADKRILSDDTGFTRGTFKNQSSAADCRAAAYVYMSTDRYTRGYRDKIR
jgi:hypothetical protein